ncbi:MAG: fibronectin type III domain-containing protein [Minisyncoccota bacterium]
MIHRSYRKLTILALIFTIGLSPVLAFAKGNDNNGKGKHKDKAEFNIAKSEKLDKKDKDEKFEIEIEIESEEEDNDNEDKKIKSKFKYKAFGHFIAPGFIKNWGWMDPEGFHFFPFGIWKKLTDNGTTTPETDTTAPVISDIDMDVDRHSAVISWDTNERADSTIYWSTTSPLNISTGTASSTEDGYRRNHEIKINDLTASTTYYIVVRSKDKNGNTTTSQQLSFVTDKSANTDTTSPIISNVVATVGTTTISLSWTTNEPANSKMFYSTTTPLVTSASTTNFVVQGSFVSNHTIQATNLATGTPYSIIIQSTDNAGNISSSPEFVATTTPSI